MARCQEKSAVQRDAWKYELQRGTKGSSNFFTGQQFSDYCKPTAIPLSLAATVGLRSVGRAASPANPGPQEEHHPQQRWPPHLPNEWFWNEPLGGCRGQ
jgi:hypothetical protein